MDYLFEPHYRMGEYLQYFNMDYKEDHVHTIY